MEDRFGRFQILHRLAVRPHGDTSLALLHGGGGFTPVVVLHRCQLCQEPDRIEHSLHREALDEQRLTARLLNHPNVVTIFEVGEHAGTGYLVSELIPGEDAAAVCALARQAGQPLDPEHVACMVHDALGGLAHGHSRVLKGSPLPLLHGGLRPSRLLVHLGQAAVKLHGFGMDRLHWLPRVTVGQGPGFAYLSPEAMLGRQTDARSDLFSLGVVLYELLSGVQPFRRETEPATAVAVRDCQLPPVAALPPALEAVVRRALARQPADRFADAPSFAAALKGCTDLARARADLRQRLSRLYPDGSPPGWPRQLVPKSC